jgi:hypothetical protein
MLDGDDGTRPVESTNRGLAPIFGCRRAFLGNVTERCRLASGDDRNE